jgi:putative salt-induced outer membrane protein YdiY
MKTPLLFAFSILSLFIFADEPAAEAEAATPTWDHTIVSSLNLSNGNSDSLLFQLGGESKYVNDKHSFNSSAAYAYGSTKTDEGEDDTTRDTSSAKAKYSYAFSEPWFGYFSTDYLQDEIADIDYRVTAGPGGGLNLIKNEKLTLSVEAGVVYFAERVGETDKNELALRFSQNYTHQLNENAKLWQSLEVLSTADDTDDYLLNAELGVESILSGNLSLRVVLQNRYDNIPAEESEKNDLILTAGISVSL